VGSVDDAVSFVDSHAHLADTAFEGDRHEVVAAARAAGARAVICIGESPGQAELALRLASEHPGFIWFTAGVHPHNADSFEQQRDTEAIRRFAASGAVAVGECGLDYHYDNSPRLMQRRAFAAQLELARELNLPVVVHTRDAEDDTAAMIREAAAAGVRGVLHCFTGSSALALTALDAGWFISFSGIITFPRFDGIEMLRSVPDTHIMVESDSPFLAPVPHRGRRNVPAWVADTIAKLADLRGAAVAEVSRITATNAANFFGVAFPPTH
jgi:TatD DNase family protein